MSIQAPTTISDTLFSRLPVDMIYDEILGRLSTLVSSDKHISLNRHNFVQYLKGFLSSVVYGGVDCDVDKLLCFEKELRAIGDDELPNKQVVEAFWKDLFAKYYGSSTENVKVARNLILFRRLVKNIDSLTLDELCSINGNSSYGDPFNITLLIGAILTGNQRLIDVGIYNASRYDIEANIMSILQATIKANDLKNFRRFIEMEGHLKSIFEVFEYDYKDLDGAKLLEDIMVHDREFLTEDTCLKMIKLLIEKEKVTVESVITKAVENNHSFIVQEICRIYYTTNTLKETISLGEEDPANLNRAIAKHLEKGNQGLLWNMKKSLKRCLGQVQEDALNLPTKKHATPSVGAAFR